MTALSMTAPRIWWLLLLTLATVTITSAGQVQPANEDGSYLLMPGIQTRPSHMRQRPVRVSIPTLPPYNGEYTHPGDRLIHGRVQSLSNHRQDHATGESPPVYRIADGMFSPDDRLGGNYSPRESPVVFPDMSGLFSSLSNKDGVVGRETGAEAAMELPEDMDVNKLDMNSMKALSNLVTIEDFAAAFGVPLPPDTAPENSNYTRGTLGGGGIAARFGPTVAGSEMIAVGAKCEPEETTIQLDLPLELNVMYFPRCVRLMRCGGCCTGPLLKCQPTQFKPVTLKVMRIESTPSGRSASDGSLRSGRPRGGSGGSTRRQRRGTSSAYYDVAEEHHTGCECLCRVQEHDCRPALHDYMQNECQCRCKNKDEQEKCESKLMTHYWDNDSCMCYCLKTEECSTGQFYDHSSCGCTNSQRLVIGSDGGSNWWGRENARSGHGPLMFGGQ